MKILVATKETQGYMQNDFNDVPDYEPVRFADNINRYMIGIHCIKGTTTIKVINVNISFNEFYQMILNSRIKEEQMRSVILNNNDIPPLTDEIKKSLLFDTHEICRIANQYPVGTILEYHSNPTRHFKIRQKENEPDMETAKIPPRAVGDSQKEEKEAES